MLNLIKWPNPLLNTLKCSLSFPAASPATRHPSRLSHPPLLFLLGRHSNLHDFLSQSIDMLTSGCAGCLGPSGRCRCGCILVLLLTLDRSLTSTIICLSRRYWNVRFLVIHHIALICSPLLVLLPQSLFLFL